MDEETMDVPSVEETPSEQPKEETPTETPTEKEETEPTTEPEEELYELPDGRKVDGDTLAKEWKENFLPDYTRKSQTLAEIERSKIKNEPTENPFSDPNYVPSTYEEVINEAEKRAISKFEAKQQEAIEKQKAIEDSIANQLSEIKKADPTLDENKLFLHANKYRFSDLTLAHQNMKDMANLIKTVQDTTVKNIAKRNDPVSTKGGQPSGSTIDPSGFQSARDYLRSLK